MELEAIASHALEVLKKLGAQHAEVSVGVGRELEVSVRQGDVELVKEAASSGLSVRVIVDQKVAVSSTTDLRRASVEAFLARAVEMAQISEADPFAAPPDPADLEHDAPILELFDPRTELIGADEGIALAKRAEAAAYAKDPRITSSEGASFGRSSAHSVLATSGGFLGQKSGTYQSLSVQAIADDAEGKKRNGSYWTGSRFMDELEDPEFVGREAADRALRFLGSAKMDTGVVPVVFEKDAARAIIGLIASCVLGDGIYRRRSYLADRLGQRIGSELLTLIDDPLLPRGPGSRAFDGEGRPVARRVVAESGILQTFLLDTYSARKLELAPTGSASGGGGIPHASTSNFYLAAGDLEPDALLRDIRRGLYVVRMMGFGFDPVTGDFSRGAEGFLIEDGKLTRPVGEITISRNLGDLLGGIDAVAKDLEFKTSIASPSFRVDAMTIGGS